MPYSCKGRSLRPSCVARRMADTAAHLVDHVLPVAPYRLWTLSLPRSIRVRVVREPALLSKVLSIFLRAVFAYQRRRARALGFFELVCPHCQGPMNRIQLVEDPAVIHRILTHVGLPTSLPPIAAARDPPQAELDLDDDCSFEL